MLPLIDKIRSLTLSIDINNQSGLQVVLVAGAYGWRNIEYNSPPRMIGTGVVRAAVAVDIGDAVPTMLLEVQ